MKVNRTIILLFVVHCTLVFVTSCARMGTPDGGWYDDTPPSVVGSSPGDKSVDVTTKKVSISFNEYIKLEDAQNKVIISPPQIEQAEVKPSGKHIFITLKDSLKANTTYTIDFSDAITDNNEGNPMGNYTFSFSTGDHIDTLEVSGYCLNAENLEPVKGVMVGLYDSFEDSLFHKKPMVRIGRTNGSGRFTIKGVAPGVYRCFALQDMDGDFVFSQKSELIAFNHDSIRPTWKPDIRQDTIWRDSLHIDSIIRVGYTHFLPDNVTMLCFQEPQTNRYLVKTERKDPDRLGLFFSYGNDTLPRLRGLNYRSDDAFILESSQKKDTLTYWLKDTLLVNQDTLRTELTYLMTDSLGQLVETVDTVEFVVKVSYEKRMKEKQKAFEKWQKEQEKRKKREERYDSVMPREWLSVKLSSGQITPLQHVYLETTEPLSRCDTSGVHLTVKVDTLWQPAACRLVAVDIRRYLLDADWQLGTEYAVEIDSAAFQGIYGLECKNMKQTIRVGNEDDYGSITMEIRGVPLSDSIVVQLLDTQDKVLEQVLADASGVAEFIYLKPGNYYMRAFIDRNGNGVWDTGLYDSDLQPEPVYYYREKIEGKAKWDLTRQWNLTSLPLFEQKPRAIVKQKPDKQKQLRNRNADRARDLGIQYNRGESK